MVEQALRNLGKMLLYDPGAPMLFSSGLFWLLFVLVLPVLALLRRGSVRMTVFVLAFSLYFYYRSSGWFVLMLLATATADWVAARQSARCQARGQRLAWMWASIATSVAVLAFFKYANFFLWNWNQMVRGNYQPLDIILPIGISFYTFQSISYAVAVYKRRLDPRGVSWLDYAFFLSFFPAILAGPIQRAENFMPQIRSTRRPTGVDIYGGLWLVIVGIVKKAVIADYIARYNDTVFMYPGAEGFQGVPALMGAVGYTLQLYCDFSGYSDMAVGLASIMGFRLGENFNFPLRSRNVAEFWHRWHISLSTWLRDFIYIPLGGNRKGKARTYVNNLLTMLIGGLWHGAAWKFVIWGGAHGVALAVHKLCRPWLARIPDNRFTVGLSWLLTFSFVVAAFTMFRAETFGDAFAILGSIFRGFSLSHLVQFAQAQPVWCVMVGIIVAAHLVPEGWAWRARAAFIRSPWVVKLAVFVAVVQCVVVYMSAEVAPFIYFQF